MVSIDDYINRVEDIFASFVKKFNGYEKRCLPAIDVTIVQLHVLNFVFKNPICKMSDLSDFFGVTLSNMTSMVERLHREGFLKRDKDSKDRRIVRIMLSSKGKKVIKDFKEHKKRNLTLFFQSMPKKELDTMISLMEKAVSYPIKNLEVKR